MTPAAATLYALRVAAEMRCMMPVQIAAARVLDKIVLRLTWGAPPKAGDAYRQVAARGRTIEEACANVWARLQTKWAAR